MQFKCSTAYKNSINNKNTKTLPSEKYKNPREFELKNPDLTPEEMKLIIKMVAPALDYNPRRIKQFINTFHVKLYIAKNTGLLNKKKDDDGNIIQEALTPEQLGKFTAISLKWPILLSYFDKNKQLLKILYECSFHKISSPRNKVLQISDSEVSKIIKYWLSHDKLRELIAYGSHEDSNAPNEYKFSLEKIPIDLLLQVSPRAFFADYEGIYCPQDISVLIDHNQ
jgi:hypothetical protein